MDDENPSTNGGTITIVISSFHYKMNPHLKPSITHDSTQKNHIQNKK
jgi:hypothetical protein